MRLPIPGVEPVTIALDRIFATGDLRLSGYDLETGARVVVVIERTEPPDTPPSHDASGLMLVLSIEQIGADQ